MHDLENRQAKKNNIPRGIDWCANLLVCLMIVYVLFGLTQYKGKMPFESEVGMKNVMENYVLHLELNSNTVR